MHSQWSHPQWSARRPVLRLRCGRCGLRSWLGRMPHAVVGTFLAITALAAAPCAANADWNWSKGTLISQINASDPSASMNDVTCPASDVCVALSEPSGDGTSTVLQAVVFNPNDPSLAKVIPFPEGAASGASVVVCPSVSECVVMVHSSGNIWDESPTDVYVLDPSSGSLSAGFDLGVDGKIFCFSDADCAVFGPGSLATFNPTNLTSAPQSIPFSDDTNLGAFTCTSSTTCYAFQGGLVAPHLATIDPATGTTTNTSVDFSGDETVCPTSSLCVTVSDTNVLLASWPYIGVTAFNPASPDSVHQQKLDGQSNMDDETLTASIVCPSASQCIVVDTNGNAYLGDPQSSARWTAIALPSDAALHLAESFNTAGPGLACPTETQCIAVAGNYIYVVSSDGQPQQPTPSSPKGGGSTSSGGSASSGSSSSGGRAGCPGAQSYGPYDDVILVGCFTADGNILETKESFLLNGIELVPNGTASFNLADDEVSGWPQISVLGVHLLPFPPIALTGAGGDLKLADTRASDPERSGEGGAGKDGTGQAKEGASGGSGESEDVCGAGGAARESDTSGASGAISGAPELDGIGLCDLSAELSTDDGGSLTLHAEADFANVLPFSSSAQNVAAVTLTFSNNAGGLSNAEGDLGTIAPFSADFGRLSGVQLGYYTFTDMEGRTYHFLGLGGQFNLEEDPLLSPTVTVALDLADYAPYLVGLDINAQNLNWCAEEVLCLDQLGGSLLYTPSALTGSGSVGLSLGPEIKVAGTSYSLLQADGSLSGEIDFPTATTPEVMQVTATAGLKFLEQPVASGTVTANFGPRGTTATIDASTGFSIAGVGFHGHVWGGFGRFGYIVNAQGQVHGFGLSGEGVGWIMNGPQGGIWLCSENFGIFFQGFGSPQVLYGGCDNGSPNASASAAGASATRSVVLSSPTSQLVVHALLLPPRQFGNVTLTTPRGKTFTAGLSEVSGSGSITAEPDPATSSMYFVVDGAQSGRYTVTAAAPLSVGSVSYATALPAVIGHVGAVSFNGRARIRWHVTATSGQSITLIAKIGSSAQTLGRYNSSSGTVTFVPTIRLSKATRVTVRGLVIENDHPSSEITLGSFWLLPPTALTKPKLAAHITRRTMTLTVARQAAVDRYEISVTAAGAQRYSWLVRSATPHLKISELPAKAKVTVEVIGESEDGRATPPARATLMS